MVKNDKIISHDNQIAKKFSEYFISIPILNMPSNGYKCPDSSQQDPILKIIDKYKVKPSFQALKFLSSVKLKSKKSKNLSKVLT